MADPDPKRCLGCGYILDGLPEPRCPECARGFDPADPKSYLARQRSGRPLKIVAYSGAAVLVYGRIAVYLSGDVSAGDPPESLMCASMIVFPAMVAEIAVLGISTRALLGPPFRLMRRLDFSMAALISALTLLWFAV
jgi:hypothetical protein